MNNEEETSRLRAAYDEGHGAGIVEGLRRAVNAIRAASAAVSGLPDSENTVGVLGGLADGLDPDSKGAPTAYVVMSRLGADSEGTPPDPG